MVKHLPFFKAIFYYRLPQLIILALLLFYSKDYCVDFICSIVEITERSKYYDFFYYLVIVALAVAWLAIAISIYQTRRYRLLTGRSLDRDRHDFNMSCGALTEFFTTNDKYQVAVDDLPIEDWHKTDGVVLCKYKDKAGQYRLLKRESNANGNLVSFGLPGSGKSTTQAATTAARFNSSLVDGGCGVFAISIKGDLLNFIADKRKNIKIFTPDKAAGSCHYNPLDGFAAMNWTDRKIFVENLSIVICPNEEGDNSAYFVEGARDYLCAITLYLQHLHDTGQRPGELKFKEIIATILSASVFEISETIKACSNPIPGEYSNGYIGSSEKNVSGVWGHLKKKVRPLNSGALETLFDGEGNCITPDDLNTCDIVIDVPQDKYEIYGPAMAIIVTNFLQAFMRRDDVSANKNVVPIMFLLDEAKNLHLDFGILSSAMSSLRSKKVSLFLLLQSVAQLEGLYGEAHAREIIDLCAYISVFNAQDPKSREYFQKLIGRRKMLKRSASLSTTPDKNDTSSTSVSIVDEYIFEAADFGDLNLYEKKRKWIKVQRRFLKKIPKWRFRKVTVTTYRVMVYANGKYLVGETTPCYE